MTHPFFLRSTLKSTHMIIGTAYVYTVHHKRVPLRDICYVRAQLIGKLVNLALGVIWGPVHGDNHDRSSAHEAADQPMSSTSLTLTTDSMCIVFMTRATCVRLSFALWCLRQRRVSAVSCRRPTVTCFTSLMASFELTSHRPLEEVLPGVHGMCQLRARQGKPSATQRHPEKQVVAAHRLRLSCASLFFLRKRKRRTRKSYMDTL